MSAGISRDEWLAAINGAEAPHPEAHTVSELCALSGVGDRAMRRRLSELEALGQVQRTWKFKKTAQTDRKRVAAFLLVTTPAPRKRR
jgi:hypothetical protein